MTYPRKSVVSLNDTPYYHVMARCVRRAWLYGFDDYAGRDYSHRKAWVTDRLTQLASIFCIDVCAYAVMSNHYHVVLHVDATRARKLTIREVAQRWTQLFAPPHLVRRWLDRKASDVERVAAEAIVEAWRSRLYDLSWFMKCMNEYLARRANAEEQCVGRFWEGRFRSQALLDEAGLLTAMVYVDLNPIRAGAAKTPEESEFTSIYQRIVERASADKSVRRRKAPSVPLMAMRAQERASTRNTLPCRLSDYLEIVDWTGRGVRADKGSIDTQLPSILQRLGIEHDAWLRSMSRRGSLLGRALGKLSSLRTHAETLGQSWIRGLDSAQRLYRA